MKQITIFLLVIAFNIFIKNAISGPIVDSNCPEFNGTCIETDDRYTPIDITVDFSGYPELENTDWSVHFTTNITDDGTFQLLNLESIGSGIYTFTHNLYMPPGDNQIGFAVYLMSENNVTEWDSETPFFDICGEIKFATQINGGLINIDQTNFGQIYAPINPRLSNPLNQDLVYVGKNFNSNFDSSLNFNQNLATFNRIYPNPIKTYFTIEYYAIQDEEVNFQIYDINGSRIYETSFTHHNTGLHSKYFNDLKLAKGIYYCKIRSDKFQNVFKVQKL